MASLSQEDPRYLNRNQRDLLRAALALRNPSTKINLTRTSAKMPAPTSQQYGSVQSLQSPDGLDNFAFDNTEFSNYLEGDTSFDFDPSELAGLNNALDSKDIHDKRKAPSDDEDDEEGDNKRGEGDDKQPKKPGRKPLTSEPTTKRKAQNRAAQRAFRERKEKHLKDLEVKVAELTKTTEHDKQENGLLRAQVDRLQSELKEYRRRMTTDGSRQSPTSLASSHLTRKDFAFEFPVFGSLPAASTQIFGNGNGSGAVSAVIKQESGSPESFSPSSRHNSAAQSPPSAVSRQRVETSATHRSDSQASNGVQSFAGLFSPTLLNGVTASSNSPDYGFPMSSNSSQTQQDSGNDTNSGLSRVFRFNSESVASINESPSQSSMSNFNANSSCNTSPALSPPKDIIPSAKPGGVNKDVTTMNSLAGTTPLNGIDFLASQNGGGFDPVLFGEYRESQDAIVGDGDFNNGFFNEAFPFDLGSPLNFNVSSPRPAPNTVKGQKVVPSPASVEATAAEKSEACQKVMQQVEKCSGGDEDYITATVNPATVSADPSDAKSNLLSANTIWNQLQGNKDFQNGSFDLDGLCSELKKKAKCSESGMMVPASDVDTVFKKLQNGK